MKETKMLSKCQRFLIVALLCVGSGPQGYGASTVLYNTFGPDDTYGNVAWGPQNINNQYVNEYALPFVPEDGTYSLDQYVLPLKKRSQDDYARLTLINDEGGSPGSIVLEDIYITDYPVDILWQDDMPAPIVVTSVVKPQLAQGSRYWVQLRAYRESYWACNTIGYHGAFACRNAVDSQWSIVNDIYYLPAMRVTGTLVPEPSILAMLGMSAFGLIAWGWRRQN
jgi:hypothetical protein